MVPAGDRDGLAALDRIEQLGEVPRGIGSGHRSHAPIISDNQIVRHRALLVRGHARNGEQVGSTTRTQIRACAAELSNDGVAAMSSELGFLRASGHASRKGRARSPSSQARGAGRPQIPTTQKVRNRAQPLTARTQRNPLQQLRGLPLGAGERDRTADLPFTRRPLCQLSYTGGDMSMLAEPDPKPRTPADLRSWLHSYLTARAAERRRHMSGGHFGLPSVC